MCIGRVKESDVYHLGLPREDIRFCHPTDVVRYRWLWSSNLASEMRDLVFSHFHLVCKKTVLVIVLSPLDFGT